MLRRIIWTVLVLGACLFALQAGEFSTKDILRQRDRKAVLQHQIDSLQRDVNLLTRTERMVRTDAATQERIAREEFGMVHGDNEILYRFAPSSDSASVRRDQR